MKRKRGNKKGRANKPNLVSTNELASNVVSLNTEDNNSGMDDFDNEDVDSGMDAEIETASPPPETSQPEKTGNFSSVGRPINNNTFGKAVYTRVKVRIKTSKAMESQRASSDAPSQSDTDRITQTVGSEKQGLPKEKTEDSANSLSETNGGLSGNTSQKSVGIKIMSRGLGSSSMSTCNNIELVKGDRIEKKDSEALHQESRNNEQELKTALEVIRKVMKMEAAEPFNAPVNPVALGIPDYFDVIETPMDFGTICNNLEKGVKYKNSEDVFKDVQYIWNNCFKYNNKGDYIVELMKRVKKNFFKYWISVGLFNDQPQENDGSETNPVKDPTSPSGGNTPVNGGASNFSGKRFHGLKKHKESCQCAICVMMRRRQERDEIARMMGGQTEASDNSMAEDDIKPEGISHGNSPFGEHAFSNTENSPDADTEMKKKGQEIKLGHVRNFYAQTPETISGAEKREGSQDLHSSHRSGDENIARHLAPQIETVGATSDEIRREMPKQNEPLDKYERAKMLENLRYLENPMLLELYGTLFSDNSQSFWNGPHSLVGRNRASKRRKSSLHSAISSLMS